MPDNKDTKAYIHKETLREIALRAVKLGKRKSDLFKVLALMPFKELEALVKRYLG